MTDLQPKTAPPSAYFTFVGSQDPKRSPQGVQGPALDLLEALLSVGTVITEVVLAWTPEAENAAWPGGYDVQRHELEAAVKALIAEVNISTLPVRVRPNAGSELLPVIARGLERFRHRGQLHVNTSSGTPQMLEVLKVLRGTGWFAGGNVCLWQVDRPEYRQDGEPYWREAGTPFLEEAFRLDAAFSALRRFDFAGAEEAFDALAAGPLELPGRALSVGTMARVAEALYWADARDSARASAVLNALEVHIPALVPLSDLIEESSRFPAEVLIWLTWGRYDRAAAQERTADALVWATVLHELLVVKLAERHGLPDTNRGLRAGDLPQGMFETLRAQVPDVVGSGGRELKFMTLKEKLAVLRAPVLNAVDVDVFDAGDRTSVPNPRLAGVREWRNLVIHQGRIATDVQLDAVDDVVLELLRAFPFEAAWAREWALDTAQVPVAAASLRAVADDLQGWVG